MIEMFLWDSENLTKSLAKQNVISVIFDQGMISRDQVLDCLCIWILLSISHLL